MKKIFSMITAKLYKNAELIYSQEGEELILRRIFENQKQGYYVDVGAHDPVRFSNTCHFYKMGWNGINIDASPSVIEKFNAKRKRDINLAIGTGNINGKMKFYIFDEQALNTFDKNRVEFLEQTTNYHHVDEKEIEIKRLEDIFIEYLPQNQIIDFVDIDVEGLDFQVLQSNDWGKFRPRVVLVEGDATKSIIELMETEIVRFMLNQGYSFYSRLYNTMIFVEKKEMKNLII